MLDLSTLDSVVDIDLCLNRSLPISCVLSSQIDKMTALTIVDDCELYLSFWGSKESGRENPSFPGSGSKKNQLVHKPLKDCSSIVAASMSLELSQDEKFIFLAGSTNMDINSGEPVLSAICFDSSLQEKTYLKLSTPSTKNIFKLKRLANTQEDILLAGCFYSISIICFNSQMCLFQELKTLSGLHSGEIFDFCIATENPEDDTDEQGFRKQTIYSCGGGDAYIHKY